MIEVGDRLFRSHDGEPAPMTFACPGGARRRCFAPQQNALAKSIDDMIHVAHHSQWHVEKMDLH